MPFELQLYHKHCTLEYHILGCFYYLDNPLRRNSEIFHRCTHAESDSCLLYQKWSKLVHLGQNPLVDSPHFIVRVRIVARHLYSRFHPHVPVWESYNCKHVLKAKSECSIGSSSI